MGPVFSIENCSERWNALLPFGLRIFLTAYLHQVANDITCCSGLPQKSRDFGGRFMKEDNMLPHRYAVNVLSQMQKTPFQAISIKDAWGLSLQPPLLGEAIATSILNALSMPMDQALALYNEALLGKGQRRTFVIDGQSWQGTLVEINEEGNAQFDWINSDHLREPPNDWLPSSQVTWCWTPPND